MRHWKHWLLGGACVVLALAGLAILDTVLGTLACGRVPALVRGTVVDAATGAPVENASVLTLFDPGILGEPEGVAARRRHAKGCAAWPRQQLLKTPPFAGYARTDAAGAFELVLGLGTSEWRGGLGLRSHHRSSPFDVVRALLVEHDGHVRLVHDTSNATWQEHQEGELAGTFDVGTIRLVPAGGR